MRLRNFVVVNFYVWKDCEKEDKFRREIVLLFFGKGKSWSLMKIYFSKDKSEY